MYDSQGSIIVKMLEEVRCPYTCCLLIYFLEPLSIFLYLLFLLLG